MPYLLVFWTTIASEERSNSSVKNAVASGRGGNHRGDADRLAGVKLHRKDRCDALCAARGVRPETT